MANAKPTPGKPEAQITNALTAVVRLLARQAAQQVLSASTETTVITVSDGRQEAEA